MQSKSDFNYVISERAGIARGNKAHELVLGRDFELVLNRLQQYCIRRMRHRELDLIVLIGAVAVADRLSRRKLSQGWGRTLNLKIPVFDLDFWRSEELLQPLREALRYLTGDNWTFTFAERRDKSHEALQLLLLEPSPSESPIIPFSGGLDSFAMLKAISDFKPSRPVLLCTTSNMKVKAVVTKLAESMNSRKHLVEIPFELRELEHAEQSYRTRPFVFFSLAALASVMMGSFSVFIGENGQGAIGPSLVTWGNEHPYHGTHPGFTARLGAFVGKVFDARIRFEHPHIWMTKAQMLRQIASAHGLEGIELTHSCSVNPSRAKGPGQPSFCGICSGCILRRLSFYGLAISHKLPEEQYLWDDLRAPSLEESSRGRCAPTNNDRLIANAAVMNHRELAEKGAAPVEDPSFARVAFEISDACRMPPGDALAATRRMVLAHRTEWSEFMDSLGPQSWVSNLGAVSL